MSPGVDPLGDDVSELGSLIVVVVVQVGHVALRAVFVKLPVGVSTGSRIARW